MYRLLWLMTYWYSWKWPPGLRRNSATSGLLILRLRNLSVVGVVCCQVEVSASGWSLVQRSSTDCGVSECYHESSTLRKPWPSGGCCVIVKKMFLLNVLTHQHKHVRFIHEGAQTFLLRTVGRQLLWAFGLQWAGRWGPVNWVAWSTDFNLLGVWLWKHLKSLV